MPFFLGGGDISNYIFTYSCKTGNGNVYTFSKELFFLIDKDF